MYCIKCGTRREGNALFCTNCGNRFDGINQVSNNNSNNADKVNQENKTVSIVLGIIGIVCSGLIVLFPIGFVLSLIGLIIATVNHKKVRNVTGIILNSIGLGLSIIIMLIVGIIWSFLAGNVIDEVVDEDSYEYYEYYDDSYF